MARRLYFVLTIAGAIAPIVLTVVFISEYGVDFGEFFDQIFASPMAGLAWLDLTISSLAFWWWISRDAPKHGIYPWWPYIPATMLVGLCFALPLYLYRRSARPDIALT